MGPKVGADDLTAAGMDHVGLQRLAREPVGSPTVGPPTLTDAGNAQRFAADHGGQVRYCYAQRTWYVWSGTHWQRDPGDAIARLAKATAKGIYLEAACCSSEERRKATGHWAAKSEDDRRLRAMVGLAQSEAGIPILPDELDADPWLLPLENGTLNLTTGALQPHRREDYITRLLPIVYDPAAACPTWEGFLRHVLGGQESLLRFMQKAIGYSLTGDTREQVIFIFHGPGANGKTTLLETVGILLGPYTARIAAETLLARPHDALALNDLFTLQGSRFVVAIESDMDRRLAESLVKQLTGGDTIKAKKLYTDIFAFRPAFKLFLATNHKPTIRGTDHAIWRRIRLVEFDVVIPEAQQDKTLPEKLKAELPGILQWALAGCQLWQAEGLGMPEAVRAATAAYRKEMDVLAGFLSEACWCDPPAEIAAGALFDAYGAWAERMREKHPLSGKKFSQALKERGFDQSRSAAGKVWLGLRLRAPDDPEGEESGSVYGCVGLNGKPPSRARYEEVYGNTVHDPTHPTLKPAPPPELKPDVWAGWDLG